MKLSIIIPVFNEQKTVEETLKRVAEVVIPQVEKEIIIVNDASTDKTLEIVKKFKNKNVRVISHDKNLGKGAAVRTGISHATGDFLVIQDADLEYNPQFLPKLFEPISDGNFTVVYGTRLKELPQLHGSMSKSRFLIHFFGNRFLSLITSILYGQWITDMETCYKIFPRDFTKKVKLQSTGFEFEPEITAKLLKNKYTIVEVPITTTPRGYTDGKKLHTLPDGMKALWTLLKYRFVD